MIVHLSKAGINLIPHAVDMHNDSSYSPMKCVVKTIAVQWVVRHSLFTLMFEGFAVKLLQLLNPMFGSSMKPSSLEIWPRSPQCRWIRHWFPVLAYNTPILRQASAVNRAQVRYDQATKKCIRRNHRGFVLAEAVWSPIQDCSTQGL